MVFESSPKLPESSSSCREQWWSSVDLRGSSGKTWFRLEGSKTAESARERRLRELKEKNVGFVGNLIRLILTLEPLPLRK
jgi:hypothetical protein